MATDIIYIEPDERVLAEEYKRVLREGDDFECLKEQVDCRPGEIGCFDGMRFINTPVEE